MEALRGNWLPYFPQYLIKAIFDGARQAVSPCIFLNGCGISGTKIQTQIVTGCLLKHFYNSGTISNHGCACSICVANCSKVASPHKGAVNITPIGKLSVVRYKGIEMLGCPVRLANGGYGIH